MSSQNVPLTTIDVTGELVIDYKTKEWCKKPYPDHKNGCPSYGKKKKIPKDSHELDECPPFAGKIEDIFDLEKRHWFVVLKFDMKAHTEQIKKRPRKDLKPWTERQARCVFYYQEGIRIRLRAECNKIRIFYPDAYFTLIPEAYGVNVIRTALRLGIPISTKPKDIIFKIAFVGFRN